MTIKIGEILKGDSHDYIVVSFSKITTVENNQVETELIIREVK